MNNNVPESTIQLLEATELNNIDQVKALVGRGVDPNAQNEYGWTALMVAAAYGREEVAEYLLSLPTIDLEARHEDGETALLLAAWQGHLRLIKLLLHSGANIEAVDHEGNNVLTWAAMGVRGILAGLP